MIWVEKIADRLPFWKASLLNLAGRTAVVRFVLFAILVYLLIATSKRFARLEGVSFGREGRM
jgi:hypothetical protein